MELAIWRLGQQNYYSAHLMKKPLSQSKIDQQRRSQKQSIQVLKIVNFDPRIQALPSSKTRYTNDEKVMRRREIVHTPNSHLYRQLPKQQEERRVRSTNELRIDNDLFGEFHKADLLNEETDNLSPVLKEKIAELRSFANKKSALSRRSDYKDPQMIHFTEYVLHSNLPANSNSTVLHSRSKRDCPFMKSVKARNFMSRSSEGRSKSQADQLFKSIQLNNSSKYAVSKRIMLSGENISNSFKESKSRGIAYGSKNYIDQRKSRVRKGQKVTMLDSSEDYRPWETQAFDHNDYEHNIYHF